MKAKIKLTDTKTKQSRIYETDGTQKAKEAAVTYFASDLVASEMASEGIGGYQLILTDIGYHSTVYFPGENFFDEEEDRIIKREKDIEVEEL